MIIVDSIYANPEDWHYDRTCLRHKKGASIWVADGLLSVKLEHGDKIGINEKQRIWRAFKWWTKHAFTENVKKGESE